MQDKENDCMFPKIPMHTEEHTVSACYAMLCIASCRVVSRPGSNASDR